MEPSVDRLRRTLRSLGLPRVAPRPEAVQILPADLDQLAALAGGDVVADARQAGFLAIKHTYALDYVHGRWPLSIALAPSPETLSLLARDDRLTEMEPASAVYLDTETTGLGTATGTLVFLVGMGRFVRDRFEVTQYFLPGPAGEQAFLAGVREGLGEQTFLVSYNGKCFDAPLLQARYTMQRRRVPLTRWPHLDLLHAARGLYRSRVPDCRLGTIERLVLGVTREDDDVPGALIPGIYFDYLRTGAVAELSRVFYHNLLDVLSLAGLGGTAAAALEGRPEASHPSDHGGAARILELSGKQDEAEEAYRRALATVSGARRVELMRRLAFLYRRRGEYGRAAELWRVLVAMGTDYDAVAHTELAKHLEHRVRDFDAALAVVEEALCLSKRCSPAIREALVHRRERLLAKASRASRQESTAVAEAQ